MLRLRKNGVQLLIERVLECGKECTEQDASQCWKIFDVLHDKGLGSIEVKVLDLFGTLDLHLRKG